MVDARNIEKKKKKKWEEDNVFEANPDDREKFFCNFPYPYINAYQHIGHFFTLMRVEALARFKRMLGYNVLFPQGWHATGSPIVNAARRVREKEEKQWKIMRDQGFSDEEIVKFEEPEYWVKFFAPEYEKDYKSVGVSVDWRRTFYTTSLNPHYDKFITWQFNKLKEKGYVTKGKFPVVWCPKEGTPVGDHDRVEGEGETPQEFTLIKMPLEGSDEFITVATLRPETQAGQTNVWVGEDIKYVRVRVNSENVKNEMWIMSEECANKLNEQDKDVEIIDELIGKDLIGKKCYAHVVERYVPILPSRFNQSNMGTGIVTSVPSDSPDDYMGLYDLQHDDESLDKYGLNKEEIKAIQPIPIIDTPELGDLPAVKVCTDLGVQNQDDRDKLENAKKEVYKKGYYEGKMKVSGYEGMPVQVAKEKIKERMLEDGKADRLYELTGNVVSRALGQCVIKIVDDQWFLDYRNPEWKKLAHKCLNQMDLYPELSRKQFEYVIDWLREWACTREEGLGTKLPWDHKWIIESLSDSTIYMAYYTIAHIVKDVDPEKLDANFFDYLLLDEGEKPDVEGIDEMKRNFDYYYPVDFRNSGKDLIQNHLTFFIFNHTAIFPEEKWPKAIGTNGFVTVDGNKMSKSLGNMILVRDMVERFTADASRITILNGGEKMDDPNWDSDFARTISSKLVNMHEFCIDNYHKHERTEVRKIDKWLESELNKIIRDSRELMNKTMFRSAIQKIYFEMQNILKHYIKRTNGDFNKEIINRFIESQLLMLTPFCPHICEETWEKIGKENYISNAIWPSCDKEKIDDKLDVYERYVEQVMEDIRSVKELAKIDDINKVKIFTAQNWKYKFFDAVKNEINSGNREFKTVLDNVMTDELKANGKEITKLLPNLLKKGVNDFPSDSEEKELLKETLPLIEKEYEAEVEINPPTTDPKAVKALPGKPAIVVE